MKTMAKRRMTASVANFKAIFFRACFSRLMGLKARSLEGDWVLSVAGFSPGELT